MSIRAGREGTLESFLKRELQLTARQIRQAKFREQGICVNGKRSRVNEMVKTGDCIEVLLETAENGSSHLVPCRQKLSILYEDEDLLIIDKPAGIVVHPSHGHYNDTVSNMLVSYFAQSNQNVCIRSVGRLDRETSGVLVFAKSRAAAGRLARQRENGIFVKTYLAAVEGVFEDQTGTIRQKIKKMPGTLMKMTVSDLGKEAVTHFRVLGCKSQISTVLLTLETGRTHQIRVHMKYLGHPLIGDQLYGTGYDGLERAALHAWKVELLQPFTGERIVAEASVPEDMSPYLTIEKEEQKCHNKIRNI